ncbi:MAG TPA: histone deacetylase, partial [Vicinamibacteria bacterium]|nr:histone deacetylase [Vicinamibacteria bacterium]
MTRVGYYDDPVFGEHDAGPGHPERPARLDAVRRGLREAGLVDALVSLAPRDATRDELLRVHSATHVDR